MKENEEYIKGYRDGFKDGLDYEKKPITYPYTYPYPPVQYPLNPMNSKCMVCGMALNGMTHYCCMNVKCPSRANYTYTYTDKISNT